MAFDRERCGAEYPHLAHDHRPGDRMRRCPGVRILDALRAQPVAARRVVLDELRRIKAQLESAVSRWNVTGVAWGGGADPVPRQVGEFPENDARAWLRLAADAQRVIAAAAQLQHYAERKAAEVAEWTRVNAEREAVKL